MGRKNNHSPKTLLITRFSALGDVCMTIPVVYGVCHANPDIRFVFLTKSGVTSMFVNKPDNLEIEGVDLKKDYDGLLGAVKLFRYVQGKYGITDFADLHSVLRTHVIRFVARLSGIRTAVIDKCRADRRRLVTAGAHATPALPPMVQRYADVFRQLGLSVPDSSTLTPPAAAMPEEIFADVIAPKSEDEVWIAIAPFAAHNGKIYPPELMKRVVDTLASRPSTTIFLFGGGENERRILGSWVKSADNIISMAEKRHGFTKELALFSQMDVAVTMDSANMHLASIAGVPVVSIWGATHPAAGFYGWKQNPDYAVQSDLPCRPCSIFGNKPCRRGDYACLHDISPEMIISKIDNILNRSHGNEPR